MFSTAARAVDADGDVEVGVRGAGGRDGGLLGGARAGAGGVDYAAAGMALKTASAMREKLETLENKLSTEIENKKFLAEELAKAEKAERDALSARDAALGQRASVEEALAHVDEINAKLQATVAVRDESIGSLRAAVDHALGRADAERGRAEDEASRAKSAEAMIVELKKAVAAGAWFSLVCARAGTRARSRSQPPPPPSSLQRMSGTRKRRRALVSRARS
jgi:hypothetical protein